MQNMWASPLAFAIRRLSTVPEVRLPSAACMQIIIRFARHTCDERITADQHTRCGQMSESRSWMRMTSGHFAGTALRQCAAFGLRRFLRCVDVLDRSRYDANPRCCARRSGPSDPAIHSTDIRYHRPQISVIRPFPRRPRARQADANQRLIDEVRVSSTLFTANAMCLIVVIVCLEFFVRSGDPPGRPYIYSIHVAR